VAFSPSSGFHHAIPRMGALFCTFSGQVIASLKIYQEFGLKGAWIDLDGHTGDSIELSYEFAPELEKAIPRVIGNINIESTHAEYLKELENYLDELGDNIQSGKIDYVVFCHGADSHEWDDLGRQLNTKEWMKCSEMFYTFMKKINYKRAKPIPLTLSLFGG
jgi:acetoin utilization deacetylase AcuC-like enzyme